MTGIFSMSVILSVTFALALGFAAGCGVKGDPLPPLRPAELGRGVPTYQRALRNVQIGEQNEEEETNVKDKK